MRVIYTIAFALPIMLPSAAWASSSATLSINAHVDTFCKIGSSESRQIEVVHGEAEIGAISEICNTPSGYEVTARFANINGGILNVAGLGYAIDSTGISVRRSNSARVQTVDWRLVSASVIQPDAPVFMQVTIMPL